MNTGWPKETSSYIERTNIMETLKKTATAKAAKTSAPKKAVQSNLPLETPRGGTFNPPESDGPPPAKDTPILPPEYFKKQKPTAPKVQTQMTPSEGLAATLRVGDTFKHDGQVHVVFMMTESRAKIAPLDSQIDYRLDDNGVPRFISATNVGISPTSEVQFIERLGRKGLAELIDKRKTESTETNMKTEKTKTEKVKTEKTPKTPKEPKVKKEGTGVAGVRSGGSLGNYEGYSIASVVRYLATKGWNAGEVRAWLDIAKIEASDQTVKFNIIRGLAGRGSVAPLKPAQVPAKPKVEAKGKAAAKPAGKPAKEKAAPAAKPAAKAKAAAPAPAAAPKKPAPGDKAAAQIAKLKAEKEAKVAAEAAAAAE